MYMYSNIIAIQTKYFKYVKAMLELPICRLWYKCVSKHMRKTKPLRYVISYLQTIFMAVFMLGTQISDDVIEFLGCGPMVRVVLKT